MLNKKTKISLARTSFSSLFIIENSYCNFSFSDEKQEWLGRTGSVPRCCLLSFYSSPYLNYIIKVHTVFVTFNYSLSK